MTVLVSFQCGRPSSGTGILGLPSPEGYLLLGGLVTVVAASVLAVLLWWRRTIPPRNPNPH